MIRFLEPHALWLLILVTILAWLRGRFGRGAALRVSTSGPSAVVAHATRSRAGGLAHFLRYLALASLVVALARPQFGTDQVDVEAKGIDIVLAVDVSGSMQALDFSENGRPVSRLAAAKDVVRKFVEGRPDDRIGLVAFAKRPYLMSPLTLDHDWLLKRLDALEDGMGEDGTAIGAALASAGNQLKDLDVKSRVVVLLTDGMNNAGKISPAAAAEAASALGIKAYTVGAGTRGEAPMPVKDAFGNVEIRMAKTDIDEKVLGEIATATGGRYFRATDTESLQKTYAEIDSLEKTTRVLEKFSNYFELFAYAVLAALMFLGAELVLGHTLFRRLP